MYIYLNDIPSWTVTHPEAVQRLPAGCHYTIAGSDGAWYERSTDCPPASDW